MVRLRGLTAFACISSAFALGPNAGAATLAPAHLGIAAQRTRSSARRRRTGDQRAVRMAALPSLPGARRRRRRKRRVAAGRRRGDRGRRAGRRAPAAIPARHDRRRRSALRRSGPGGRLRRRDERAERARRTRLRRHTAVHARAVGAAADDRRRPSGSCSRASRRPRPGVRGPGSGCRAPGSASSAGRTAWRAPFTTRPACRWERGAT